MIQPYIKIKMPSIMIWAAFWGFDKSDLIRTARDEESARGGYSAASYLGVVEDQLPTIYSNRPKLI